METVFKNDHSIACDQL